MYGGGMLRVIDTIRGENRTHYRLAEDEESEETYRIEVMRGARGTLYFAVYCRQARGGPSVKMEHVPSFLMPCVLQVLGDGFGFPTGAFGEEPRGWVTHDYQELLEVARAALEEGPYLGSYPVPRPEQRPGYTFRYRDDPGWDEAEYLDYVSESGAELSPEELEFRLLWGRTFGQDEITRAIVEVLAEPRWRDRSVEEAPSLGMLRARVSEALSSGVSLGSYLSLNGQWVTPEMVCWVSEVYERVARHSNVDLSEGERRFRGAISSYGSEAITRAVVEELRESGIIGGTDSGSSPG